MPVLNIGPGRTAWAMLHRLRSLLAVPGREGLITDNQWRGGSASRE